MTEQRLPRVCLESPYAAPTDFEREANVAYARLCMEDSLNRGEAPFLGHLLYTQVYEDRVPELRRKGINAHLAWLRGAEKVVLYMDRGISSGMTEALILAERLNLPFEFRRILEKP